MQLQVLISALMCVCGAGAATTQTYSKLGVLHPSSDRDLGPYENSVSAVLDVLPEITEVFQRISDQPARSDDFGLDTVQRIALAFLPITRKVLEASAKAEGRSVRPDELRRLAQVEKVFPTVLSYVGAFQNTNFYGGGFEPARSAGQPTPVSGPASPSQATPSETTSSMSVSATGLSTSFVRLPNGPAYFIDHSTSHS